MLLIPFIKSSSSFTLTQACQTNNTLLPYQGCFHDALERFGKSLFLGTNWLLLWWKRLWLQLFHPSICPSTPHRIVLFQLASPSGFVWQWCAEPTKKKKRNGSGREKKNIKQLNKQIRASCLSSPNCFEFWFCWKNCSVLFSNILIPKLLYLGKNCITNYKDMNSISYLNKMHSLAFYF